jgi:hypothetical protein
VRRFIHILAALMLCALMPGASAAQRSGPNGNLPLPPETLRLRLQDDEFEVVGDKYAGGGVMGAQKVTLKFRRDGFTTEAKWKATPTGGDAWNSSPRREIASYAVQQLFLDPDDYVVPPVAARCIPLDVYKAIDAEAKPNLDHGRCVFGALSAWMQNVKPPDEPILDEHRFHDDPRYAYYFGNLNLLSYLIKHKDTKPGNILISTDPSNPQLFSVDNGIAFGHTLFNFFALHFNRLVVGGVPKRSIERLRQVTRADLDKLGVVGELRDDGSGVLRSVPASANIHPDQGVRQFADGIQFGLTREEIAAVWERLQAVRERIGHGDLQMF